MYNHVCADMQQWRRSHLLSCLAGDDEVEDAEEVDEDGRQDDIEHEVGRLAFKRQTVSQTTEHRVVCLQGRV